MNRNTFKEYILEADFRGLFVSELGWNKPKGNTRFLPIVVDDTEYPFNSVAERNGLQVIVAEVDALPTNTLARRIDAQLRKQAQDYIAIFKASGRRGHHVWIVPVKNVDKRDLVSIEYENPDKADFLLQKLDFITFGLGEATTIVDVKEGVNRAFAVNSERITKDFYSGFKKEHATFAKFITGIDDNIAVRDNRNKQWYASVMLNRLMFCYFIQKKGFLDGNVDYLRNKLDWVRLEKGKDRFFGTFYKKFLTQLFSDGLNTPEHGNEFTVKFGLIPYLNGGMFDTHPIERDYTDIDIADDAFISLFTFFDRWQWHLDTRVTASGRDINPDVLGYIFEQYINDRAAMGAYYTKEDITEYIGRNCILPFLFNEVKRTAKDDGGYFKPEGYVWLTLRKSGNRYIFDAVKKGYEYFDDIPENISKGIITDAMHHEYSELPIENLPEDHVPLAELRSDWNTKTPEQWGLPSEIWRETIERIQRCRNILHRIESGKITSINDFITYNLDIRSFAHDLLAKGDSRFISRFYDALKKVTILDPTCGSGAFLFAAMNILEPLYEICIERMQEFNVENPNLFKQELEEINNRYRSNIQYFIFKSIILRNLYGVDIMAEATEIAKLRLFLKMVAVVDVDYRAENLGLDPLPDIDFNIRCGNTLVGYANKEQLYKDLNDGQGSFDVMIANEEFKEQITGEMDKVARAYDVFKDIQLRQSEDMLAFKLAKTELHARLVELNDKLNRRLYLASTGFSHNQSVDFTTSKSYREWLVSHQPFHWLAEFYQIIEGNHGFDVIIGNPPYVEITKNKIDYSLNSWKYKDLYAYVLDRALILSKDSEYIGFIIPISFNTTPGFQDIYKKYATGELYISCYADTARMFQVTKRLSIVLKFRSIGNRYITRYIKNSVDMAHRLANAPYQKVNNDIIRFDNIPAKISFSIEKSIINKYFTNAESISKSVVVNGQLLYYTRAIRNFRPFFDFIPCHKNADGSDKIPTETKSLSVKETKYIEILGTLNASITFAVFSWYTDVRNINSGIINQLCIPIIDDSYEIKRLTNSLILDFKRNKETRFNQTNRCLESYYFPVKSKSIIDKIDIILAKYYGFTDEELDFIINYDIKYRMGDELNN